MAKEELQDMKVSYIIGDSTRYMNITDNEKIITSYINDICYKTSQGNNQDNKIKYIKYNTLTIGKIDKAIGKIIGDSHYNALEKFFKLYDNAYNKDGTYKNEYNKYEKILYELMEKWKQLIIFPDLIIINNIGGLEPIDILDITKNFTNWYNFNTDMTRGIEYLENRDIEVKRQEQDKEDLSKNDAIFKLKPKINNTFMRSVWDLIHVPMAINIDSKATVNSFPKSEIVKNKSVGLITYAQKEITTFVNIQSPIPVKILLPTEFITSFSGRDKKNSSVIDMIEWLQNCNVNNQDLKEKLIKLLVLLQANIENACTKDAIGYATLGVSSIFVTAWNVGTYISNSNTQKKEIANLIVTIENAESLGSKKPEELNNEIVTLFITGLSIIFSEYIDKSWNNENITNLFNTCLEASKK